MGKILPLKRSDYTPLPIPDEHIIREKRGSYFTFPHEFTRRWSKILGHCPTLVYLHLCSMADRQGKCFPSMETITERVGYRKREVMKALKMLEFYELLTIQREDRKVNVYWLTSTKQWKFPGERNRLVSPVDFFLG